jgi:hypothetical protein
MRNLTGGLVRIIVLAAINGLIIWHVFAWNAVDKYDEMYLWLGTGKAYLAVLYNLGLMLVFGLSIGLLTGQVVELLSRSGGRKNG